MAVLLAVAAVAIVVTHRRSTSKPKIAVHGAVASLSAGFFADPQVKGCVRRRRLRRAGAIGRRPGTPQRRPDSRRLRARVQRGRRAAHPARSHRHRDVPSRSRRRSSSRTFRDIAQLLERAGVAHAYGTYWTFDMHRYLDLVRAGTALEPTPEEHDLWRRPARARVDDRSRRVGCDRDVRRGRRATSPTMTGS